MLVLCGAGCPHDLSRPGQEGGPVLDADAGSGSDMALDSSGIPEAGQFDVGPWPEGGAGFDLALDQGNAPDTGKAPDMGKIQDKAVPPPDLAVPPPDMATPPPDMVTLLPDKAITPDKGSPCGNGNIDLGEQCDGTNLAGKTSPAAARGKGGFLVAWVDQRNFYQNIYTSLVTP